ncbi:MAG: chaperonin GroEL [Firmicutes bacterium]|nr:chaperonin GroEL [Bacillota bacterium]
MDAKLITGTQKLADVVGATLGPRGRNVAIGINGLPLVTNDGVTIARHYNLDDATEDMGAKILLQASNQTNTHAGDGTTSAIVLGAQIIRLGARAIELGECPIKLKEELLADSQRITAEISRIAKPIASPEEILAVATNSCANRDDGLMVAEAFCLVDVDGVVMVEENTTGKTTLTHNDGCEVAASLATPHMIENPSKMETEVDDAHVLLCGAPIQRATDILPALEIAARDKLNMVIVAPSFGADVVGAVLLNRVRAGLRVLLVRIDEMGERRTAVTDDIAALLGGTVMGTRDDLRLADVKRECLGHAKKIACGMDVMRISSSKNGDELGARVELIRSQIAAATDEYTRGGLQQRLAKLTHGIAVISVGAATEVELRERRLRIDDAVCAVRAAGAEGTVPGGGITYLQLSKHARSAVLRDALAKITHKIICNAGENSDIIIPKILRSKCPDFGYDALAKRFCNMRESNIVDPARVVRQVIQNATSVAATLLTTNSVVFAA